MFILRQKCVQIPFYYFDLIVLIEGINILRIAPQSVVAFYSFLHLYNWFQTEFVTDILFGSILLLSISYDFILYHDRENNSLANSDISDFEQ